MTDKQLIFIFFPASGKTYEFWVPVNYKISYINQLIVDFFTEHPQGGYIPDRNSVLCDKNSGRVLNGNLEILQLEKMDNPVLMLV